MKIDLDWIQKELDAGNRVFLEYADENAASKFYSESNTFEINNVFITGRNYKNEGYIELKDDIMCLLLSKRVLLAEFEYFRIKRHVSTFDDLIDVAVQASKDGLLEINKLDKDFITAKIPGNSDSIFLTSYRDKPQNFKSDIADIKSLYTETFTIDDFQDTKKLKSGDKALLANGEEVIFSNRSGVDDSLWFEYSGFQSAVIPYIALKGATITQKRGK